MKIGTTTFAFRYLFLDRARAPSLECVVEKARDYGLEVLQICENARPMALSAAEWHRVVATADRVGMEIQLGCKTTDPAVFREYLDRAAALPNRLLRMVFEQDGRCPPQRSAIADFLREVWPLIEKANVRLAMENHFDVPSRVLAEAVAPYAPQQLGFCVDTANSLRNFESTHTVLDLLGGRAFCYHLKDYLVTGDQLGFRVAGAPLGEGALDLDGVLDCMFAHHSAPLIFLENWVPSTGDWTTDVCADEIWTRRSLASLRERLGRRGISA